MEYYDELLDGLEDSEAQEFEVRRKIASNYGWNFNNFKKLVAQFITRKNDEDQWVFDFKSYCYCLSEKNYEHPLKWAKEFYRDDFLVAKYEEFLSRLLTGIKTKQKWKHAKLR
jgi:hypothetical protein